MGVRIADAMECTRRAGIVHRDIKPANSILDAAGVVWVADFGLATRFFPIRN